MRLTNSAGAAGRTDRAGGAGMVRGFGRFVGLPVAAALVALAVTITAAPTMPASLEVSGRSSAHVSLAADGPFVVAVWAGSLPDGAADIYAATSRDGGATFSSPVRVNTVSGDARVNGEQPPRVALTRRPSTASATTTPAITVVWTAKGASGTVLRTARSADGARTFTPPAIVPGTDSAGNRGWEAMTAGTNGEVHLAWLDHRRLAQADAAKSSAAPVAHHEHGASMATMADGGGMAQLSDLYVASLDGTRPPQAVTAGVCYCCKTALAVSPDGTMNVAWRHVYPGNLRDIAFTSSKDGGRTFNAPLRVSEDKWQLDGCPDDGPAMAIDGEGQVHLIWPTLVHDDKNQPTIGLFYASSRAGDRFTARLSLPTEGLPHHPQIIVQAGAVVAAWDELKNGVRQVVVARASLHNRALSFSRTIVTGSAGGVYPSLVGTDTAAVVAWTSGAGPGSVVKAVPLQKHD